MLSHILIALVLCVAGSQQAKIKVDVYYESLCPDSQKYLTEQLYPSAKQFAQNLDVKLIPYGKSTYTTRGADVTFQCHHGPNECYGNKVQSCAIEHIQIDSYRKDHTRESLIMEYVNCLMQIGNNFPDSVYPGKHCAEQTEVHNWDVIRECANSTEGSKLLQKNGELTQKFQSPLKSVPTIVFNDKFDASNQDLALVNMLSAICKNFEQGTERPLACQRSGASSLISASALVLVSVISALAFK